MDFKWKKWTYGIVVAAFTVLAFKSLINAFPRLLLMGFEMCGYLDHLLPESRMNTLEIIRHHGFEGEIHNVTTPDGWILEIHRIPFGINHQIDSNQSGNIVRHPVFLLHGFSCSSGIWVVNGVENSLGFVLANAGYDVFMGNLRGNCYTKHKTFTDDQDEYWQFAIDDHALLDLSTMIDYTLNLTGQKKLTFVGHSMGATSFLMLLSGRHEYNNKIEHAFLQAPVIFNEFGKSLLVYLARNYEMARVIREGLKSGEYYFTFNPTIRQLIVLACSFPKGIFFCNQIMSQIAGYNHQHLNSERLHAFMAHILYGTSRQVNQQFSQMFLESKQHRLDLGREENMKRYSSEKPPDYNLTSITAPLTCYWSYMDAFTDPKDVERLQQTLPSNVTFERIPIDVWNHFDFLLQRDVTKYHYNRLLKRMAEYLKT